MFVTTQNVCGCYICVIILYSHYFWYRWLFWHNIGGNGDGNLQSRETTQYDVIHFTKSPEEHEANVYLTIPDDALSQPNENAEALPDSAIKRTEFADKLASMTDEDFRRQFKVTDIIFYSWIDELVAVVQKLS